MMQDWTGCDEMNAEDSLKKCGVAVRPLNQAEGDFFDCYLPVPGKKGYVFRMLISLSDVDKRFDRSTDMGKNDCRANGIKPITFSDADMADKLNIVCTYLDFFKFFELTEELPSIPIADVDLNQVEIEEVFKVEPLKK